MKKTTTSDCQMVTRIDVMETDTTRISNTAGCYMSERKSMSNSHFVVVNQGACLKCMREQIEGVMTFWVIMGRRDKTA